MAYAEVSPTAALFDGAAHRNPARESCPNSKRRAEEHTMNATDDITDDNMISTALHNAAGEGAMLVVFADGSTTSGPRVLVEGFLEVSTQEVARTFDGAVVAGWIADAGTDWHAAVDRYRREIAA
ncbi:hypothetical protein GCM10020255_023230 [Rhodococcus baikonurensis]|nr:hypothetical protein ABM90_03955 [Rhodococcus erythropolis]KZF17882.1 hypothetical protein A2J01_22425 [Rhodococcus sp. EPR-134]